ncbi:MAG: tetratricopeptide repeat protein [Gemmatimonadaceae bacterium]|nr:tetratricopeptide repeat protein [Gemmatimonadaceae bacterium]
MADNARIEDLRKRYHENPRRFFAPLANEYRKAGFLDRAILLCEKHLGEQPGNLNGLVVYGQTLYEGGRAADARDPFERALELDPENLIALRHLGDVARLLGERDEARKWYERVLELDRRNDEVIALVAELGSAPTPEGQPPAASAADTLGADVTLMDIGDVEPPPALPEASSILSVTNSVRVTRGDASVDVRMLDADLPTAPPPKKTAAGPGKTAVIDAQSLADRDRAEAEADAGAADSPGAGSLIDVEFAFDDPGTGTDDDVNLLAATATPMAEPKAGPAPDAMTSADAAGSDDDLLDISDLDVSGAPDVSDAPTVESVPSAPSNDAAGALIVESTGAGESLSEPSGEMDGLELAEFSSDAAPLAGLESTEFVDGASEPLAGLELPMEVDAPAATSEAEPAAVDDIPPIADLAPEPVVEPEAARELEPAIEPEPPTAPAASAESEPPTTPAASVDSDPPTALAASAEPETPVVLDELPPEEEPPSLSERGSAPRPRMTKASMASLPLLADYGLEDGPDESAAATPIPTPTPTETPASRESKRTPSIATETMATLYLQQGHRQQAIDVYRQLLEQSPDDAELRAKLSALEAQEMPDFEAPSADEPPPEPAPANAVLADVHFGEVGLRTPTPAKGVQLPAAVGPSAREFFGMFARRGAAAAAAPAPIVVEPPPAAAIVEAGAEPQPEIAAAEPAADPEVAPAPAAASAEAAPASSSAADTGWPFDALLGEPGDPADESAGQVLASVATFEGPSGGTGLDALFDGAGAATDPVAEPPSAPRKSVPRISQSLKFDQFFSPTAPTGDAAAPQEPPGDDDLGQFQDWLHGLKP